jgi:long-subunit fatty acid transport protein
LVTASTATAGGLFTPGSGAISTSRAGAAVASVDDGEALGINPAGLAKAKGVKLTISTQLLQYYMSFSRRGTYDALLPTADNGAPLSYEGQPYATVENDPKPPLGFAGFQPLPVIAVSWDLGGRVPGLTLGGGLYTPSGYPFRDMSNGYEFQTAPGANNTAPPPTRYDVMTQESALLFPSIAAAYRITPDLDVGVRLTAGNFKSKTQVVVWGTPANWEEDVSKDALFTADVKDSFIPAAGLGATYRIGPNIELGANWSSPIVIKSQGTAVSLRGPGNDPLRTIGPLPDDVARCAKGGTVEEQKACINLQLPMSATIGGRYKILDDQGAEKADIELDVAWENWGKRCDFSTDDKILGSSCTSPGQYRVQVDSGLYTNGTYTGMPLHTNAVNLGLRDTFGARLGGSYRVPVGDAKLVGRAGVSYDTAAAKEGWLRANFDGASRVMGALGLSYDTGSWQVNAGFGYIHEGTNENPGAAADGSDCNPTPANPVGCGAGGAIRVPNDRQGPDPTNPLVGPDVQTENPYNQGSITSHYLTFLLGFSKSF